MKPVVTPLEIARHVRDARQGSQAAFAWLYRTFWPLVYAIHLGMAPRARAEELAQETFALAFDRLGQLRAADRFGPWIAMIARRNLPAPTPHEVSWADDDPASGAAGPDSAAEARRVLEAVRALPEAYREPLMLRLVEGLSGPEIATLTGLTPQSVRVNLHRGMAKLRNALGIAAVQEENAHA